MNLTVARAGIALISGLTLLFLAVPGQAQLRFTLRAPILIGVGADTGVQSIVTADVNKDNTPDIVVLDQVGEGIAVFLNDGAGNFGDPRRFANTELFDTPTAIAVADVGSSFTSDSRGRPDGNVDIIVADDTGLITFLYGAGNGDFEFAEESLDLDATDLVGIAVGNFDGQGTDDDIAALDALGEVFFGCSTGDGVYGPCLTDLLDVEDTADEAGEPVDIATGDFDGNGTTDVVALYSEPSGAGNLVFLAQGDGTGNFTAGRTAAADDDARALARGRLDSDAIDDLIVGEAQGNSLGDNLTILRGSDNGTFRRGKASLDVFTTAVTLSNINNDANGCLDAIGVSSEGGTATFALGNCDGTFSDQLVTGPAVGTGRAVKSTDFNRDGLQDFVVVAEAGDRIRVAVNNAGGPTDTPGSPVVGSPTATPTPTRGVTPALEGCETPILQSGNAQPVAMAQDDFDKDGDPDLAIAAQTGNQILVMLTRPSTLNGPTSMCDVPTPVPYLLRTSPTDTVGSRPVSLAVGNLNLNDKFPDIVAVAEDGIWVLLGTGLMGRFQTPRKLSVDTSDPRSVAIADLNDDGIADLAIANRGNPTSSGNVTVLFGMTGDGLTFEERALRPRFIVPGAVIVVAANLDNQRLPDLAVASDTSSNVQIFLQNGEPGEFRAPTAPATIPTVPLNGARIPVAMIAAELTSSPVSRLVILMRTNPGEGSFGVISRPNAAFELGGVINTQRNPSAIAIGDFIAGGDKDDAAVTSAETGKVSFYPGTPDGFFGTEVSTSDVGDTPMAVVAGDYDGDEHTDVVVANLDSGTLSFLLTSRVPPTPTPTSTNTMGTPASPTNTRTSGPTTPPTRGPTSTPKEGSFELSSCSISHTQGGDGAGSMVLFGVGVGLWIVRRRTAAPR